MYVNYIQNDFNLCVINFISSSCPCSKLFIFFKKIMPICDLDQIEVIIIEKTYPLTGRYGNKMSDHTIFVIAPK